MDSLRAWTRQVNQGDAASWEVFKTALRGEQVALAEGLDELGMPGLLLFHAFNDEVVQELAALRRQGPGVIIAVTTSRANLGACGSWQLLQAGAEDVFILDECVDPAAAMSARLRRIAELEELIRGPVVRENLVGESAAWRQALREAVEIGRYSHSPILITGESGTGKELVARLVHTLDTRPDKGKLVVLDCTTIVPELSGSEFFGHERGAFTNALAARDGVFALADKGTLFLDEVGELPLGLQAALLRAVQERVYKRVGGNAWQQADFRLVCATNRDLQAEEAKGAFRLDFYHRIACAQCHLPPLRERREDILPLARHFLCELAAYDPPLDLDPSVQDFLLTRDYAGNVRELRQLVRRIAGRHVGPGPITAGSIPRRDRPAALGLLNHDWRGDEFQKAIRRALATGAGLQEIKNETVEAVIELALRDAEGNVHRAAARLRVTDRAIQMRRAAQREPTSGNGHSPTRPPRQVPHSPDHDTQLGKRGTIP